MASTFAGDLAGGLGRGGRHRNGQAFERGGGGSGGPAAHRTVAFPAAPGGGLSSKHPFAAARFRTPSHEPPPNFHPEHPRTHRGHVPMGEMAARHGRRGRAARLRPRRVGACGGGVSRLWPPGGHHGRLRPRPFAQPPVFRCDRSPDPPPDSQIRRAGRIDRRPQRPWRAAFRVHEQRRRAGPAHAGRHPDGGPPRPAARPHADAAGVRVDPRRHDDPHRHPAQPDHLRLSREHRRGQLRDV